MRVGLFVTNQQYLATDMVNALDEQITMVRLVRDKGWDSLFSGQHYLNEGNNQQLQLVPLLYQWWHQQVYILLQRDKIYQY